MTKMHFNKTIKMLSTKICIVFTCLIISVSQNSCNFSGASRKGDVSILDVRNSKVPEVNLAAHKKYDVVIYRRIFFGDVYLVRYYQNENDTLKSHEASYGAEEDFDKVAYSWLCDTSVSIRLHNTVSKKEKSFKVFGYGPRSGMSDY